MADSWRNTHTRHTLRTPQPAAVPHACPLPRLPCQAATTAADPYPDTHVHASSASAVSLRRQRLREASPADRLPATYAAYGMTGIKPHPPPHPHADPPGHAHGRAHGHHERIAALADGISPDKLQVWPLPSWLASPYVLPPLTKAPKRKKPWLNGRARITGPASPSASQYELTAVVP